MVTMAFINQIMSNVFHAGDAAPFPTAYFVGLSQTEPKADGSGFTEPTVNGYARAEIKALAAPQDGLVTNTEDIAYEESTEDWGTITHYGIFDCATGGTPLLFDALTKPKTVQSETQFRIPTGGMKIRLQNP